MSDGDVKNKARATVCLTVDFDAVSPWMQWGARGIRMMSRGEFGVNVGAPRMLEMTKQFGIETTWFIPAHTADTWPDITAEVAECGHEIANHAYLHESFEGRSVEESRELLQKGNESLKRVTGQTPKGFRLPAGDANGEFLELLVEEGFTYDSSTSANDFSPYWCRSADELHEDGPNILGTPIDLVEIPMSFVMNDFHHFEFNYGTPFLVGHAAPSQVEEIFTAEFDYMYERIDGGILTLIVHPQSIGHGLRMAMLERWVEHCLSHEGTRFAKVETVVEEFRARERENGTLPTKAGVT
jgi:peptidoglycan/xylan/chitin deacetylase (PgdA/CDA1 family)